MKINRKMINPKLRFASYILNFLVGSDERGFRRTNKAFKLFMSSNIKGYECREEYIESRDEGKKIRVRIFRPANDRNDLPGVLYMHGGGYAMGLPETELGTIKGLLERRDCVVVAPDYRTSLQNPYPAAPEDCYDTLLWMTENCETLGFSNRRIITAGLSAGGGLTVAVNLMSRDENGPEIVFSMPLYPMLDDRMSTCSMRDNNSPVWNEKRSREAWKLYLRNTSEEDITYYAAPGRCVDFTGHPPVCTFIGSLDPFLDETRGFVKKLKEAGIETDFKIYDGAYHSFEIASPNADISKAAKKFYLNSFENAVDSYFTNQKGI